MKLLHALIATLLITCTLASNAADTVVYEGVKGPGKGKHIVFISGDEEYRSEEGLPMLAKILALRHGFKCTVLFALNPADGTIDPNNQSNVVGLKTLTSADLVVMLLRFREFPDDQMKYFVDYLNSGKPIIALRTSTHSFAYSRNKTSPYAKFDWQAKEWPGGFGQHVLGDTWVNHHGNHGVESTRAVIDPKFAKHPILTGVKDVWGPTDVYTIAHLPADATVLAHGQVLTGMKPTDGPVDGPKNNPMMPLIWTREYHGENGTSNKILCTTMGAATDLQCADLRRLIVNGAYWAVGLEKKIKAKSSVDIVGDYQPTPFGFGKFKKGVKPADHELR